MTQRLLLLMQRLRLAAALLATVVVAVGAGSQVGAQTPSTSSDEIANEAQIALLAYDRWAEAGRPIDYVAFVRARNHTAQLTADDLGIDTEALVDEWGDVNLVKQRTVLAAMSQLGVPYRSIASEPGVGFDCSGLTIWAYGSADVEIPRVSGDQLRASERVERDDAEPGDLVHYPGHVGIYLGGDSYVHSPYSGSVVEAVLLPGRSLSFGDLVDV